MTGDQLSEGDTKEELKEVVISWKKGESKRQRQNHMMDKRLSEMDSKASRENEKLKITFLRKDGCLRCGTKSVNCSQVKCLIERKEVQEMILTFIRSTRKTKRKLTEREKLVEWEPKRKCRTERQRSDPGDNKK